MDDHICSKKNTKLKKSGLSGLFSASLELTKEGLINIMQKKNCKNLDELLVEVHTTPRVQTLKDLNEAYKSLNELYKSGALTESEFITQKKKILGQ